MDKTEIDNLAYALIGEIEYDTYTHDYGEVVIDYNETACNLLNKGIGDKLCAVENFSTNFWNNICDTLNVVMGPEPQLRIKTKKLIEEVLHNTLKDLIDEGRI